MSQRLSPITLGTARVSRVEASPACTFGVTPKQASDCSKKIRDREDPLTSVRDARATQIYQEDTRQSRELTRTFFGFCRRALVSFAVIRVIPWPQHTTNPEI
jgi:hypothetical protein